MKKIYSKPEIMFESFTLSENIAGDCEFKTKLPSKDNCGYEAGRGNVIFISKETGCTYTSPDGYDTICYHVPNDNSELFNS